MNFIETKDYYETVKASFGTDNDLLEKWHIKSGNGIESCVNDTIGQFEGFLNFRFYVIKDDNKTVGFVGIEDKVFLTTFCIIPGYRSPDNMKTFWSWIRNNLEKNFYSSLYKKNEPAIQFFIKNGAEIVSENRHNDNEILVFRFREL